MLSPICLALLHLCLDFFKKKEVPDYVLCAFKERLGKREEAVDYQHSSQWVSVTLKEDVT